MLLSLAAIGAGIWTITRVDHVNTVCSNNASPLTGAGLGPNCENVVSFYFIGFAFVLLGLILLMLSLISRAKSERVSRRQSALRAETKMRQHEHDAQEREAHEHDYRDRA
jgi:hypothetical protein